MQKLIIFFSLINFLTFTGCNNRKDQSNSNNENAKIEDEIFTESESYLGYEYILMDKDNKIVVTFPKKFLPRNDEIVVGAIKSVIAKSYSEIIPENSKATLEKRNGLGLIKLSGKKTTYYTQLIKEDNGEVNSFLLWGEDK